MRAKEGAGDRHENGRPQKKRRNVTIDDIRRLVAKLENEGRKK